MPPFIVKVAHEAWPQGIANVADGVLSSKGKNCTQRLTSTITVTITCEHQQLRAQKFMIQQKASEHHGAHLFPHFLAGTERANYVKTKITKSQKIAGKKWG